jgi:starch synthase (maltosyl-transferring)
MIEEGRKRVIIEDVSPVIDNGRFPAKALEGDLLDVEADVFADGHDLIAADLLYKHESEAEWKSITLAPLVNDRWKGSINLERTGIYRFHIKGWIDTFRTIQHDIKAKMNAEEDILPDVSEALEIMKKGVQLSDPETGRSLEGFISLAEKSTGTDLVRILLDERLFLLLRGCVPSWSITQSEIFDVLAENRDTGFSSWYEVFPRSWKKSSSEQGTLKSLSSFVPFIADMGFDVLYLSPVHPIGKTNRKGRNNSKISKEGDPGSPWAIGSEEGGHKSLHPALGDVEDFKNLVAEADRKGMKVALDLAFQCSPDHPYVKDHPEWFSWRPDGTIQYAQNPPKKYEDVVPFNFECDNWEDLWKELKSVVEYWISLGVKIFRVDNPHTKPLVFWEWLIREIRKEHREVFFLAEAFTRPKVMYRLAKAGFSHSYTYFTWRNTPGEMREYMNELCETDVRYFFRPNFWPNTPDILPEYLQYGGRPAFVIRLVLAATLSSNYGIYGPAFDLCENRAVEGREEYLNSEKYEIKEWDLHDPQAGIRPVIKSINNIRKNNPALQNTCNLTFFDVDNENILFYAKADRELSNIIFTAVNLDPFHIQEGHVNIPLERFGIDAEQPYLLEDLLGGEKYIWHGGRNYVKLDPGVLPAHILRVQSRLKRENDFDYFL